MINWGTVPAGSVLPFHFASYDGATGASEAISGLAVTDIEVYKGTTVTQRASDAGFALIDTDGIDIDSIVGANGFSIDTGDNTDAGFYTVGSFFTVWVSSITADGQTVNFIAGTFRLCAAESTSGTPKADVSMFGGTAGTFASGRPEVNTTHFGGTAATTSAGRPEVNTTHAAGTAWGSGAITAASIAADAITAAKIADGAIDAGAIAADAITAAKIADGAIDAATFAASAITSTVLANDAITAAKIADGAIDAATFANNAITAASIAADAITAAKIADGAIDAATFAANAITSTVIANDAITDAKVAADVTIASVTGAVGSVTGAVGSVTGAVGSVTGAVGSVTGNVGGNVVGTVASVVGNVGGNVTGSVGSVVAEVTADMVKISGDSGAADRLEAMMDGILVCQVNDTAATTTAFAADGFTEATDDHFNGRLITFLTGNLAGQQTAITDYDAAGHAQGNQAFVVDALTEAPANNDTFVIH